MKKVVFLITFLLCGVFAYAQTSTENIGGLLYSIDTEAKTATLKLIGKKRYIVDWVDKGCQWFTSVYSIGGILKVCRI